MDIAVDNAGVRRHVGQSALLLNPPNGNYRDYPFAGLGANPNDLQAVRNYTERYEYDAVGNFDLMRHIANGGSLTRSYDYDEASLIEPSKKSNRLTRTTVGNGFNHVEAYTYKDMQSKDVHGCMTAINSKRMEWDFKDQLHATQRQVVNDGRGWPRIEGDLSAIERLNDGYRRICKELNKVIVGQQLHDVADALATDDDHHLTDPHPGQCLDRVVDHRPVVDRQQVLVGDDRQRVEAGRRPAGKNDAFHRGEA
jgi:hypothetical protein